MPRSRTLFLTQLGPVAARVQRRALHRISTPVPQRLTYGCSDTASDAIENSVAYPEPEEVADPGQGPLETALSCHNQTDPLPNLDRAPSPLIVRMPRGILRGLKLTRCRFDRASMEHAIPNLLLHDKPVPLANMRSHGRNSVFVYCSNTGCHHDRQIGR